MNRSLTVLFAAYEAALVVAIGIGISLAPLTVLWGAQFGFASDWVIFWRASVDIWLLGHGVDLMVTLDPAVAAGLGLDGAAATFPLTIAALGFSLISVLLGVRAGRRIAETRFRRLGEIAAIGTFGALSLAVTFTALYPFVRPSLVQGTLLPTAIFGVAVLFGSMRTRRAVGDDTGSSIHDWIADWRPEVRSVVAFSLRGGAAATLAIVAVAGLVLAWRIAVNYAQVVSLYESMHTGVLGGFALTLAQLAFLPNLVIWTAAWLVGPGFAFGTGSMVNPIATQLGPLPSIPILGALPSGDSAFGFLGLLVPVIVGFAIGAGTQRGLRAPLGGAGSGVDPRLLVGLSAAGVGLIGGLGLGLLSWFSTGAAGPGRLLDVGPQPFIVGVVAAAEIGLAALAGILAGGANDRRLLARTGAETRAVQHSR